MFDNLILTIKSAISPFCRALDSFEHINMQEHLNEMLCFVGVTGYKTGNNYISLSGGQFLEAEVKITIDILADRNMTASQLSGFADNTVIPVLVNPDIALKSLVRKNCKFSKVHSRYVTSIELELDDKIPISPCEGATVMLNGVLEPVLSYCHVIKGIKTSQTPLVGKMSISSIVCPLPNRIILSGKLPLNEADTALSRYSLLSVAPVPVNVGASFYNNMQITNIDLKQISPTGCEITLELTEVNE